MKSFFFFSNYFSYENYYTNNAYPKPSFIKIAYMTMIK